MDSVKNIIIVKEGLGVGDTNRSPPCQIWGISTTTTYQCLYGKVYFSFVLRLTREKYHLSNILSGELKLFRKAPLE